MPPSLLAPDRISLHALALLSPPQQQSYLSGNNRVLSRGPRSACFEHLPGPAAAVIGLARQNPVLSLKPDSMLQSRKGAALIYKYPILLDACANEMQRKGDAMMAKWAEVMTCMRPKSYFLRPDVAVSLGFAVIREFWNQHVVGRPDLYKAGGK